MLFKDKSKNRMPSFIITTMSKKEEVKTVVVDYDKQHLDIGRTFLRLLETERIDAASNMMADGFFYTSVTFNAGKDEWLSSSHNGSKSTRFGELEVLNEYQLVRRGTRQVGFFLTIRVKEILEFNEEGKIVRISRL